MPASARAASTVLSIAAACASMASVGTTPPHGAWMSACVAQGTIHEGAELQTNLLQRLRTAGRLRQATVAESDNVAACDYVKDSLNSRSLAA